MGKKYTINDFKKVLISTDDDNTIWSTNFDDTCIVIISKEKSPSQSHFQLLFEQMGGDSE